MLALLRNISESFPPDVQVDVNIVRLSDRSLWVEGVLYNGDLKKVEEALKKQVTFNNVTLDLQGQRFTFKGEILGK